MARNQRMDQGHIDEGTLHAWLDGALAPEESARVEAHVNACAECGAAAAEARGLVAAASRILTALDDVPGGVAPGGTGAGCVSSASRDRASTARRRWTGWPLRVAAAVVFVAAGSLAVIQRSGVLRYGVPESQPLPALAPPSEAPAPATDSVAAPAAAPVPAKKQPVAARKRDAIAAKPAPAEKIAPQAEAAPMVTAPAPGAQSFGYVDSSRRATGPVTITGRVVEAKTGQPVSDAQVRLSNPPVIAATNANGDYALQVPANQATGQPAQLSVRRIGFESKIDSVTLASMAAADTVHHDIALATSTTTLSQVVVTGAGARAAKSSASPQRAPAGVADAAQLARSRPRRVPSAPGCYTINTPGLPAQIEIGERLRVLPPDSAAFPTAYWMPVGRIAVRLVLTDTSGITREVRGMIVNEGLSGSFTRSDSTGVATPFSATWTAPHCP